MLGDWTMSQGTTVPEPFLEVRGIDARRRQE